MKSSKLYKPRSLMFLQTIAQRVQQGPLLFPLLGAICQGQTHVFKQKFRVVCTKFVKIYRVISHLGLLSTKQQKRAFDMVKFEHAKADNSACPFEIMDATTKFRWQEDATSAAEIQQTLLKSFKIQLKMKR